MLSFIHVIKVIFGNKRHWTSKPSLLLLVFPGLCVPGASRRCRLTTRDIWAATATPAVTPGHTGNCSQSNLTVGLKVFNVSSGIAFDPWLGWRGWDWWTGVVAVSVWGFQWESLPGWHSSLLAKQWCTRNKKGENPGRFLKPCFSRNNNFKIFDFFGFLS